MKKGGSGGSSTKSGLLFEGRVNLASQLLSIPGYTVLNDNVYFNNKKVAQLLGKNKLYKKLLEPQNISWNTVISKRLLPDEAILVMDTQELFIIEMKFQSGAGSVDEKLQTCDFKKKQYIKLLAPLNLKVNYTYILNDWFLAPGYKDVLEYIESSGCNYFFSEVPLSYLGLPY